ncbi:hypothetical protein [Streptomyces millisiae]|uniref:Uncharacterized protein n=1 Tax=Streptomyces millisiae TaxID=3075542 RepID=A0ABU2LP13_9ACTN|nr:hypothetical protein [Streptomyces sp. DSM 44918]MDT0319313.1 hypothetical protein [Streptomyces sp. DSM 44918]
MSAPAPLAELHEALRSDQPIEVLDASWEAFDLGAQAADAVAWTDGFDELQSLAAAQICTEGRDMFFPPQTGSPPPLPESRDEALDSCAELLRHVHRALIELSNHPQVPTDSVLNAAALAEKAALSLESIRTP